MKDIDLGPQPQRVFDPTTCEITTDGRLIEQPSKLSERADTRMERSFFVSDAALVRVHGAERAAEIRRVMGDEYGRDL